MHLAFSRTVDRCHHNQNIRVILGINDCRVILHIDTDTLRIGCEKFSGFVGCVDVFGYACRNLIPVPGDLVAHRFLNLFRSILVDIGRFIDAPEDTAAVSCGCVVLCAVFFQHLTVELSCLIVVLLHKAVDLIHSQNVDQAVGGAVVARRKHGIDQ